MSLDDNSKTFIQTFSPRLFTAVSSSKNIFLTGINYEFIHSVYLNIQLHLNSSVIQTAYASLRNNGIWLHNSELNYDFELIRLEESESNPTWLDALVQFDKLSHYCRTLLTSIKVLFIENIENYNSDEWSWMSFMFRCAHMSSSKFGGIQVIARGDFCMKPPNNKGKYVFESDDWNIDDMFVCNIGLKHSLHADLLNKMRHGLCTDEMINSLYQTPYESSFQIIPTQLNSSSEMAKYINEKCMDELMKQSRPYIYLPDENRILCDHTQVYFSKNCMTTVINGKEIRPVPAGSRAVILKVSTQHPLVRLTDGTCVFAIAQLLKPAWALGVNEIEPLMKIDSAEINMITSLHNSHDLYKAFSSLKDITCMRIRVMYKQGFALPAKIVEFYTGLSKIDNEAHGICL